MERWGMTKGAPISTPMSEKKLFSFWARRVRNAIRTASSRRIRTPWARGSSSCRPAGECFFSSRRRHSSFGCDWSSDVCSSDLAGMTIREDLSHQSNGATQGHAQRPSPLNDAQRAEIVSFETGVFFAQVLDFDAGLLQLDRKRGV